MVGSSSSEAGAAYQAAGWRDAVSRAIAGTMNPATSAIIPGYRSPMDEVEVVVAHSERATVRVGDVFLKADADEARIDAECESLVTNGLLPARLPAGLDVVAVAVAVAVAVTAVAVAVAVGVRAPGADRWPIRPSLRGCDWCRPCAEEAQQACGPQFGQQQPMQALHCRSPSSAQSRSRRRRSRADSGPLPYAGPSAAGLRAMRKAWAVRSANLPS
ncbi:aminoglycoside phosphotransferase [Streptomyces paromomycinus]|uniref:Aminoglycoside phosphotransferase n=1 Tax=Streptomyces paromomycinus TaxID=92743 RepID=A0A401VZ74_STREY|nr:aminoglycoside phosphotransferase [Streptomyces paromomycinus]